MTATGDVSRSATTFDVEELVTRAWHGDIRVPHFQRAFRWKWEDTRRLFDSIVKNYPIGSLLLWVRRSPGQRLRLGALRVDAPESNNALWVVDGQQRITSLANALHEGTQSDPRFALAYHLRDERFVEPRGGDDPLAVPLPVLFDPQQVMQWFWQRPEIYDYFDTASAITTKIRKYSIPAYQVEHDDERVLEDIFDRMNSYGKRLTKAEVFSALNAGTEDAAGDRLTFPAMAAHVDEDRSFGMIDEGTVLQAVLARRHPDIQREIRNEFTEPGDEEQDIAYEAAEDALRRSVAFLQDDAGVPHIAMLPYRYLLVVLVRFFAHHPEPDPQNLRLLRRWYWRAAAVGPGIFLGGTTGATRNLGRRIAVGSETGSVQGLLAELGEEPTEPPVPDVRKFRTNAAASKLILCSWWDVQPRNPETGDVFGRAELAENLPDQWTASDAVYTLLMPAQLPDGYRSSAANRVLLPMPMFRHGPGDIPELLLRNVEGLDAEVWNAVRRSHWMTPELADLLASGRLQEFLSQRQELLHAGITDFLRRNCEWGFEDTPAYSPFPRGPAGQHRRQHRRP